MKKKITRIYKKEKTKVQKRTILLIILLISIIMALHFGNFTRANEIKEISYINYYTTDNFDDKIKIQEDEEGKYISLPEEVNNKKVSEFYIYDNTEINYKPKDKYYITDDIDKLSFLVIYQEENEQNELSLIQEQSEETNVTNLVYVGECGQEGEEGNETNPYKTFERAVSEINSNEGTIIVKGTLNLTSWYADAKKNLTIQGYNQNSKILINGDLTLQGNTYFKDITFMIPASSTYRTIYANGYNLTIGEEKKNTNVKVISEDGKYPYIYGGSNSRDITGNTNIIINSGSFQSVYGGSKSKNITGDTNLTIKYATIINSVYGGSYGATINGNTNINIYGGIYGTGIQDATVMSVAGGSDNTGVIKKNSNLYVENAKIVNGSIGGAGTTSTVENTVNTIIKNISLGLNNDGTNSIYGAAYRGGNTGSKQVNFEVDNIKGKPEYIIGYSNISGGAASGTVRMNLKNINSENTQIYGGSYKCTATNNVSLVANMENVKVKLLSAGGSVQNKIYKYDISINNGCKFYDSLYLGISTEKQTNVATSSNVLKVTNLGNANNIQSVNIKNQGATITLNNSYLLAKENMSQSAITLNNSNMNIEGLYGNLSGVNIDQNSLLTINKAKNININGNINGRGTIKLEDNSNIMVKGKVIGNINIDISENSQLQDHYINIISLSEQEGNELKFNENLENYKTEFLKASTSFWRFYTNQGITGKGEFVYIDANYGDDGNEGDIVSPVRTILQASKIISNNAQKKKAVIMSDVNLNNEKKDNTISSDETIIITGTDGVINFAKSIKLNDTNRVNNIYQNIQFENIYISSSNGEQSIYANGNNFIIGNSVTTSGTINIYGGSYDTSIEESNISIYSGTWNNIYGGSNKKNVKNTNLTIISGSFNGKIVGGNNTQETTYSTNIEIKNGTFNNDIIAGNMNGQLDGTSTLTITKGVMKKSIYGGNYEGVLNGNSVVTINGGEYYGNIFAGSNLGEITGDVTLNIETTTAIISGGIYGGSNSGKITGTVTSNISGNRFSGIIYGGSNTGEIEGNVIVNLNKGSFSNKIFAGSFSGDIEKNVSLNVNGGTFTNAVYGGNGGNNSSKGNIIGDINVTINGGTFSNVIYAGGSYGNINNVSTIINNMTFASAITIYGGGENLTQKGNSELTIKNSNFNNSANIYGGAKDGTVNGSIKLNIKDTNFTGATTIYRGCNNASYSPNQDLNISESFENINITSNNSAIYGGSNTGVINSDLSFSIIDGMFLNNSCKAVIYGGSNSGTINGSLNFEVNGVTLENNIIGTSNTGNITKNSTVNINNSTLRGKLYAIKYSGNNITGNIQTNVTDSSLKEIYAFQNYTSVNVETDIQLTNITNNVSQNGILVLPVENNSNVDLSNCLNIKVTDSRSAINITKPVNFKTFDLNNTECNIEENFKVKNLKVLNFSKMNFEKDAIISTQFIGENSERYAEINAYSDFEIAGTIQGKTILGIGIIKTSNISNEDLSFVDKKNINGDISKIEENHKIWQVGYLNNFDTVYVNGQDGNDENKGNVPEDAVKSFKTAYLYLKNGGTIVVSGTTSITKWPSVTNKTATITSKINNIDYRKTSNANLILDCIDTTTDSIVLQADTKFEYLNMVINATSFIYANGYKLILGVEGVEDSLNITNGKNYLNIFGGTYNSNVNQSYIEINSGSYKTIYGASKGAYTIGTQDTRGKIVQNIIIRGGEIGTSQSSNAIVMGNFGNANSFTNGATNLEIANSTINGYILSSGFCSTTYGDASIIIKDGTEINGTIFTDGNSSNIDSNYKCNLKVEGNDKTIFIKNIIYGSINKHNSSKLYETNIKNATIENIYYGSLTTNGNADTVKGDVNINIGEGAKIGNIYAGRYINDSTAAGNFYVIFENDEDIATNIYRKSPNSGGVSSNLEVILQNKNISYSGTIQGATKLLIENSTINFSSTLSNIAELNVLNNSEVNVSSNNFGFSNLISKMSNISLSQKTNILQLGSMNIDAETTIKILSSSKNVTINGKFTGGGKLYLNDDIRLQINGIVENTTRVYCNGDSYFPTDAVIIATQSNNTLDKAFIKEDGSKWQYKDNEGKRIWQIGEFENDNIIYVNSSLGSSYGLGTLGMPVNTLDLAYKIANKRYSEYNMYRKFYIILQKDLTLTSKTTTQLNDDIEVVITNKFEEQNLNYGTKLKINTAQFVFGGKTTLEDLNIDATWGEIEFFGNGNNITIGKNVDINAQDKKYPILYGGSENGGISKEQYELNILSGNYNMIFGGSKKGNDNSNIVLNIGNDNSSIDVTKYGNDDDGHTGVFGSAREGERTGDITININSGNFYRIYGAGMNANTIGNVYINYKGGTTNRLYGGGQRGRLSNNSENEKGNANISIGNKGKQAIIKGFLRGSGQYEGLDGESNINISEGAKILQNAQVAAGGYQGNVSRSTLNITGGEINTDIYGGGWGIIGDTSKGQVGNTNISVLNTKINGDIYGGGYAGTANATTIYLENSSAKNVYGGGNEAKVSTNTNIRIKDSNISENIYGGGKGLTAIVQNNSDVIIEGTTNIKQNVFGGGNNASTGTKNSNSKCSIYIYGGTINEDVYGGANKAVIYGNTEVAIGKESQQQIENIKRGNINILGTVFGGGKSNTAGSENYDFTFESVVGNVNIEIDAKDYNEEFSLDIGKSIFASGNAAKISGNGYINLANYGNKEKPKKMISIQRADNIDIINSSIWIQGTTDRTNELSQIKYTFNRIKRLTLKDNTVLYLANGVNLLEGITSEDINGDLEKIEISDTKVTKNVDNKIYLLQGKNLILTSENGQNGFVNGQIFLGKYTGTGTISMGVYSDKYEKGNILNKDDKDLFYKNSYAQTLHYSEDESLINGFHTNNILTGDVIEVEYIVPTSNDASYSQWIVGEISDTITYEDIELIASKYASTSKYNLNLTGISEPNTTFSIEGFDTRDLNTDVVLKSRYDVPDMAQDAESANSEFALIMQNGLNGWIANGITEFYTQNNEGNNYSGMNYYVSDNSNSTLGLSFNFIHSKNISESKTLGNVTIKLKAKYLQNDELVIKDIIIVLSLIMNNDDSSISYYEGAITPGIKYETFTNEITNITSKSSFSAYYSIYLNNYDTNKYYENYEGYYHCLQLMKSLPENTKITMIDLAKKQYYYYVISNEDFTNNKTIYKMTEFRKMGTLDQFYDGDSSYYNKNGNYVYEEFIFQFDFSKAEIIDNNYNNQNVILQLRDKYDDNIKLTVNDEIYPMIFSIYYNKEATKGLSIENTRYNLYTIDNIDVNIQTKYMYKYINSNIVYDTTNFDTTNGIKLTFYKGTEILSNEEIKSISVTYDGKEFFAREDGTIVFKITDNVSNVKTSFKINLSQKEDWEKDTQYSVLVENVALSQEKYVTNKIAEESLVFNVWSSQYGLKAEFVNENDQIIEAKTGTTLDGNNNVTLNLRYSGVFSNAKIKIALARRNYNSPYSTEYENIDLSNYISNILENTNDKKEYTILTKDMISEFQPITLNLKQNLQTGSYKIKFILYDGEQYIGEIYKMIIIK